MQLCVFPAIHVPHQSGPPGYGEPTIEVTQHRGVKELQSSAVSRILGVAHSDNIEAESNNSQDGQRDQ